MQAPNRIVTGHDAQGRAVVAIEGPPPGVHRLRQIPGTVFYELWSCAGVPARLDTGIDDPSAMSLMLPPPKGGTRIRMVDIPPDTPEFLARGAERMAEAFAQIGDAQASTVAEDSPHPLMHRTETLDYGIVIAGEIVLVLDAEERVLKAGDVIVQRGTNHAWANRSGEVCRMAFILVDGAYAPELAALLPQVHR